MIRVLEGGDVIPTSILSGDDLLNMPGSDSWTPSSTIVDTLQVCVIRSIIAAVFVFFCGRGVKKAGRDGMGWKRGGGL